MWFIIYSIFDLKKEMQMLTGEKLFSCKVHGSPVSPTHPPEKKNSVEKYGPVFLANPT